MAIRVHWTNPWSEAIPVPLDELAEAIAGGVTLTVGSNTVGNPEYLIEQWRKYHGVRLDAYVLPRKDQPWYSVGIRYGNRGDEYLSPSTFGREAQVEALLAKYS